MFRARQLSNLLTSFPIKSICTTKNSVEIHSISLSKNLACSRFYSSKKDDDKVRDQKPQKTSTPTLKNDCKAVNVNPFYPTRPVTVKGKIPSIQDCPTPNIMSDIPAPECGYEENDNKNRKNGKRVLIFGLLFTAVTLGAAYSVGLINKPSGEVKKVKKKKEKFRSPATSAEIPKKVPYLLIGGGTASFSAFRAIKSSEPTAKVLVVSEEAYYPYMRPPLSKEIWFNDDKDSVKKLIFKQWNGSERSLFYEPEDFYMDCKDLLDAPNGGVAVARGWKITKLDVLEKKAYLEDGKEISYDKCLVATGAKTKKMAVFENSAASDEEIADRVKYYRDIKDFEQVDKLFDKSKSIAVIGGGFLGSELACALARKDKNGEKEILQVFRESGNMGKVLPEYLSFWTTDKVTAEGVTVKTNVEVISVRSKNKQLVLTLNDNSTLTVDNVIIAVGVEPNTDLAVKSELEVDPDLGGYLVNSELQARSSLYIAGDCSCFYDPLLGRRRIEHHDHAVVSGRLAGENMTGAAKPYTHQSMFWSDLGPDVGYEAIGIVDSSLPTVGVFAKATFKDNPQAAVTKTDECDRSKMEETPKDCQKSLTEQQSAELRDLQRQQNKPNEKEGEDFGKGVIFYLKDDIVVGIVLWNVFNRMSTARQVLKSQEKYENLNEVAKLFNIHED